MKSSAAYIVFFVLTIPCQISAQESGETAERLDRLEGELRSALEELRSARAELSEVRQKLSPESHFSTNESTQEAPTQVDLTHHIEPSGGVAPCQYLTSELCSDTACSSCDAASNLFGEPCGSGRWTKGQFEVTPFGAITGEMIGSEISPQLRGSPLFLLPGPAPGIDDSRFTVSGQQSTVGLSVQGPQLGSFQSGGIVAVNFFGEQPVQNNPGPFFMLANAELRNDSWRFWIGQDGDGIGRQNTNSPAWSSHKMQGNFGQLRPGFRVERYFQFSDSHASAIYFGLTQQAVNDFIADPEIAGVDNGWPNIELRWELTSNQASGRQRDLLFAIGAVVGETRAVDTMALSGANVSTTWAIIPEFRIEGERFGFQGEAFIGEAMGTYNGAIGQSLNPNTGEPIYSIGGFGEIFWKVTSSFTTSVGYGIDDPRDRDLGLIGGLIGQRARNESLWLNFIWRISEEWETRFEISHLETTYIAPSNDASSMIYHALVRFSF